MARGSTAIPAVPRTQKAQERKWAAEDALRTLTRAAEIQQDKGLMRDAKALANQQVAKLAAVAKGGGKGR